VFTARYGQFISLYNINCNIQPMQHTHLYLHVAVSNGQRAKTENSQKEMLFRNSRSTGYEEFSVSIPRPFHGSDGQSVISHDEGPGSI
jgi:hypothetical protein